MTHLLIAFTFWEAAIRRTYPSVAHPSIIAAGIRCRKIGRGAYDLCVLSLANVGVWLLSVFATVLMPCLPLLIEWLKNGHVQSENVTLTAAVMASAFAVTSEHPLTFVAHLALFVVSLVLDFATTPASPIAIDHWAGTLLIAVGSVHATERLVWHVVLSRSFPDGLQFGKKAGQP